MDVDSCRPSIAEGQDYREFLLALFLWNKQLNSRHSYRFLASRLAMDVGHVHRILNGKKHLPLKSIPKVVERLKLDPEAAQMLTRQVMVVQGTLQRGARDGLIFPQPEVAEIRAFSPRCA